MKDSVYETVPTTLEELAGRVEHFFQNLDHHLIQNAFNNCINLVLCVSIKMVEILKIYCNFNKIYNFRCRFFN